MDEQEVQMLCSLQELLVEVVHELQRLNNTMVEVKQAIDNQNPA
jgi:hypothetical protein